MPKIIKKGTKLEEKFTGTCQKCGSETEWELFELTVVHDRDGRFADVTCPVCQTSMWAYPKGFK